MLAHGSYAGRPHRSVNDANDSVANRSRLQQLRKIKVSRAVGARLRFTKMSKKGFGSTPLNAANPLFGATPQRHHVMPYGRLLKLPIHGNLLGGLGGHPLRVVHLAETNDATSLRLAFISATRLPEGPRSTRVRVGAPPSESRLSRRLQHHCSRA